MTTIMAKRCSFCGKPAACVTRVMAAGDGVSICITCTTSAMRQFVARYHASTDAILGDI